MNKRNEALAVITIAVLVVTLVVLVSKQQNIPYFKSSNHVQAINKTSVEILLQKSYDTFLVQKQGIIHIGAHYGEELPIYKNFDIKDILWIEADPQAEEKLLTATSTDPDSKVAIFAATDTNGAITLFRTSNDGMSSSIFKLKNHKYMSPDVAAAGTIKTVQKRLDDYLINEPVIANNKYNVLVIDVQGAELVALKGAVHTLRNIDAIIAEVNYDELYSGGVYIQDLDKFLAEHDFVRVDSISVKRGYGDALYVKCRLCMYSG